MFLRTDVPIAASRPPLSFADSPQVARAHADLERLAQMEHAVPQAVSVATLLISANPLIASRTVTSRQSVDSMVYPGRISVPLTFAAVSTVCKTHFSSPTSSR